MIIAIPTNNTNKFAEIPGRGQNAAYCKYVSDAGYTPILIPMEADPVIIAQMADGLLLAGGIDVDPIHYGVSNICSHGVDPEKDAAERELFHTFREYKKPIFGICRGFQLMFRELLNEHEERDDYNEYFEYLENIGEHAQTGNLGVPRKFPSHQVRANISSMFGIPVEKMPDKNPIRLTPVNSMHHQAVICNFGMAARDLTPELLKNPKVDRTEPLFTQIMDVELIAWSMRGVQLPTKKVDKKVTPDYDNYWTVVEAARITRWGSPIMGVQWHPEELGDIRLIRNFFGDGKKVAVDKAINA